ncbi:MAG: exopolyphosphatase [Thiomicrorhabdus chilensis]|uniref:exopolyphosphatase n=1 Tax=Thiomicrorhabdus chilensis TaxID=63656 RepID=UPI00299EDE46|nr:exopolyphosphatase [Thiomicrorhabdus chilensis]MDX1347865.1 exopolyphosphatase [Thiomicrorhabdus chilensis]
MKTTETDPQNASQDSGLFAAIDLGSNSFHMIIARETHGQMQVIDKHKEMVRLRAGLQADGTLNEKAFNKAIACLERFGQRINNIPAQNVRAVGTNTLRNARNSRTFLQQASKALGHNIQIIAGQEEARLIYLGVAHGLPNSDEQRLVMDIGGGSTEFIIGKGFTHNHLTSTEMGCVSITQGFFADDEISASKMNQAISSCRLTLRPHQGKLKKLGWDTAIGASGTIKSIGQILEVNHWSEGGITLKGLYQLRDVLIETQSAAALSLEGLKDERRPVLAGGLAVLIASFEELNIQQMQVSSNALREGLVFDTLGRLFAEDARELSVAAMQQWMHVDTQQAEHVAKTAMNLFKQAHNIWQLRNTEYNFKKLLNWAANLHECGIAISYKRYRHHSAYLIAQAEMAGFDQQEKQMLSTMLLNHRGKFIIEAYDEIDIEPQKLLYLTVLLRLAVRIHRGRDFEVIKPILFIENDTQLHLEFDEHWLEQHPLSRLDLEIEAKRLDAAGFQLTFE